MTKILNTIGLSALMMLGICSCQKDNLQSNGQDQDQMPETSMNTLSAIISDGLNDKWNVGNPIVLAHDGQTLLVEAQKSEVTSTLSNTIEAAFTNDNPLYGVYPADNMTAYDRESVTVTIPSAQTAGENGYDEKAVVSAGRSISDSMDFYTIGGGIKLTFNFSGVTKVELESVDGNALAGSARIVWDENGKPIPEKITNGEYILLFNAPDESGFTQGKDYYISTFPCDVYGGYRLSIYKDGLVANYFGVHQMVGRNEYVIPNDLVESELEFMEIDAPLVEEERPALDATTSALLREYQKDPTDKNKQALLEQMGLRYDKVVARKKSKLRELEREAKTPNLVAEMQAIVDEMVDNRDIRLEQQFLRLIDPRNDDNPKDAWMVLRGSSAPNAYIGYAPVTNAEYAAFHKDFIYAEGKANYPVVNITIANATEYCDWLASQDKTHAYRLPTDEEWILGAGHMPKDVTMNAGHVEQGLTAVDAFSQTTGACGGIDFWGNCWEWTSSMDSNGLYIVKGGSWDSDRDDCRSEKSDIVKAGTQGYANVGFRVVRTDLN